MATPILNTPDIRMADLRSNREDTSAAYAVKSLGGMLLEIDKQVAEARLDRDISSAVQAYSNLALSDPKAAAGGPQDIIENPDYRTYGGMKLNALENPKYIKELDKLKSMLGENEAAYQQGALTTLAFRARVENITREAIARRPGLRRELTAVAAQTLGYDPTGSQLKALMAAATDESKKKDPYQEGLDLAKKREGELVGTVMRANPGMTEEKAKETASTITKLELDAQEAQQMVEHYRNKSALSSNEMAVLFDKHRDRYDSIFGQVMLLSDASKYSTQEAWDQNVRATQAKIDADYDKLRADMERSNWWSNPFSQADALKRLDEIREYNREQFEVASALWKSSLDGKTATLNQNMLKEKWASWVYLKGALKNYPEVYAAAVAGNWNLVTAQLPASLSGNVRVVSAMNTIAGNATPQAAPSAGAKPASAQRTPNPFSEVENQAASRWMDRRRTPNTATDAKLYYGGAGVDAARLWSANPEGKMQQANWNQLDESLKGLKYGLTKIPGGAVGVETKSGQATLQFYAIAPDDPNPRTTPVEQGLLALARSMNNSDRTDIPEATMREANSVLSLGLQGYVNQLVANAEKPFTLASGGYLPKELVRMEAVEAGGVKLLRASAVGTRPHSKEATDRALLSAQELANRYNRVATALIKTGVGDEGIAALNDYTTGIAGAWQ